MAIALGARTSLLQGQKWFVQRSEVKMNLVHFYKQAEIGNEVTASSRRSQDTRLKLCVRYHRYMKQIEQTYEIKAPIGSVWKALTDGPTAEQWGAGPAKVDAHEGGEFSYWDGDIHGSFTKLVPEKLIEQNWYGHDHPDRKFTIRFDFKEENGTTTIKMTYSGPIEDEQKDIKDWQEYYFDPIKDLLEV